jgi:hypothetical protein
MSNEFTYKCLFITRNYIFDQFYEYTNLQKDLMIAMVAIRFPSRFKGIIFRKLLYQPNYSNNKTKTGF